jgi:hypothetical protein
MALMPGRGGVFLSRSLAPGDTEGRKEETAMRKVVLVSFGVVLAMILLTAAASAGVCRGEGEDPNYPELGIIHFLKNPSGFKFEFTPIDDVNWYGTLYEQGHSYRNFYKLQGGNPNSWCGPIVFSSTPLYDMMGISGQEVLYRVHDVTSGTQRLPCP